MKYRDLAALLREHGCHPVRVSGTHEVWRTAAGTSLPPVPLHADGEVSIGVRTKVLRAPRLASG